ncbi:ABC transporter substrate-binding protein [Vibrio sp. SS-MA-C1-2]|uniref:ABC transporter substrate-binding protein n=1 Tax=Vibrio sp. SS-MA-C1-2 TaxID=2908646 RepID=UPI001F2C20F4|nr:ABC transporter substrate-binding protein [Vibrio sp. SS-MA-C1-2]UJF18699.1 ABC transporter substrate-binding protein [Vibrio sp. SS-MA-C1-2]
MKKNKITQTLLLAAGLTVSAISANAIAATIPEGTKLAADQELVRGNGTEVASLDPHKTEGVPESNVIRDLMEGLATQDADGNVVPGVAASWETEDNKHFVFHLRKDAKWSNGDPVTAHDFVYSFQRAVDPNTASPYSWYLEMTTMVGATDIIAGKADKNTLGVKATDDYTLEIQLEKAIPYFVSMTAHTTMMPVHKGTVEKFGDKWTSPEHYVGNGAFKMDKWVVNERIVMMPNENYWDAENTVITKLTYLPIENQVAEMNRFLAGEIDITYEIPNEHIKRLRKDEADKLKITPYLCSYYYGFNLQKKPFDDVRVRQALSYAIDREILTKFVIGKGDLPAYNFAHQKVAGLEVHPAPYSEMTQKERTAEAKRLLAEAGFGEDNPLEFTLLYNTSENHKKIAVAIASMYKKGVNVKVNLENQEWKTFLETRRSGDFDVTRAGWCGDYNEASTFLSLMQSNNSNNDGKYVSEAYDSIMSRAQDSTSEAERSALYAEAETVLAADMPIAPIYHYVQARLVNPELGGYPYNNAQDNIYSKDLYFVAK